MVEQTQHHELPLTPDVVDAGVYALCRFNWETESEESAVRRISTAIFQEWAKTRPQVRAWLESDAPKISPQIEEINTSTCSGHRYEKYRNPERGSQP